MIVGRYDFRWRRRDSHALIVLLAICACVLAFKAVTHPLHFGPQVPVDADRVASAAEKINPNTATVASLRRLGGIGPVKAAAIFDYAAAHGRATFTKPEDLTAVKGIGPATVERLRPYLIFPPQGD